MIGGDLWQGCHNIAEKGSKIVPLGAPLLLTAPIGVTLLLQKSLFLLFVAQVAQLKKNQDPHARTIPAATLRLVLNRQRRSQ
jgi:hypothetical protein